LKFLRTDPDNRPSQAFPGFAVGFEKFYGGVYRLENMGLVKQEGQKVMARFDFVSEHAPEGKKVSAFSFPAIGGTGFDAFPAVNAAFFLKGQGGFLFVHLDKVYGTNGFAKPAVGTGRAAPFGEKTAFDSQIVLLGLEAVVPAARNADFEFMGQFPAKVPGVQFFRKSACFNRTAGADSRSLAGRNGPHPGAAGAGLYLDGGKLLFYRLDIAQGHKGNFHALPGCKMDITLTVFIRDFADFFKLTGPDLAADYAKPQGKFVLLDLPHKSALF
jgi:hypothetical protein